jgi:hypothetical protein
MALSMTIPNGRASSMPAADLDIFLSYDLETYAVTVNPEKIDRNEVKTICFKGTNGNTVRVVFPSPFGEILEMFDSEVRTLTNGGIYNFRCFFTPPGGSEIESLTGGVIDVQPHRP